MNTPIDPDIEVIGQLRDLIDTSHALQAVYDPHDRVRYANAAFREAFFIDSSESPTWEQFIRRNYARHRGTVLNVTDLDGWILSVKSRRRQVMHRAFETDMHDGRWIWAVETLLPNGWMHFVGTDVTNFRASDRELRQDRDHALKASHTDELTNISNRRHIMMLLEQLLTNPSGGCACLLDIDHFKHLNDTLGHTTGDAVLRNFAELLRRSIRMCDGLGRIGGEEFMILMPGASEVEGVAILENVFDAVRRARLVPMDPHYSLSFSAGLLAVQPGQDSAAVYRDCDRALYMAKNGGRDRMQVHGRAA